jgi:RNA polymerase nonessential primary-like sigma factor
MERYGNKTEYTDEEQSPASDLLRIYLNGIGKTALLNAAEEVELAQRIEAGVYAGRLLEGTGAETDKERKKGFQARKELTDEERGDLELLQADGAAAKRHLMEANLRLVVSLAKRYSGRGMPLLDIIQEGNLGLNRATEKFDYTKGFKFSTYATWWIRQSITRGMAEQTRTIRLPIHYVEQVNKMGTTQRELLAELGRQPTNEELAVEMDLPLETIEGMIRASRHPVSLDDEVGDEDGTASLGEFVEDSDALPVEDQVAYRDMQRDVGKVLATLEPREQAVIRMRFGLDDGQPKKLDAIGKIFGISRERVRQIERDVKAKLRTGDRADTLRSHYEE